jgi:hypothetical protein
LNKIIKKIIIGIWIMIIISSIIMADIGATPPENKIWYDSLAIYYKDDMNNTKGMIRIDFQTGKDRIIDLNQLKTDLSIESKINRILKQYTPINPIPTLFTKSEEDLILK